MIDGSLLYIFSIWPDQVLDVTSLLTTTAKQSSSVQEIKCSVIPLVGVRKRMRGLCATVAGGDMKKLSNVITFPPDGFLFPLEREFLSGAQCGSHMDKVGHSKAAGSKAE